MISIVIRTKNEAKAIEKTLQLCLSQKEVPEFEIIVIDSGSTDGTLDIIRRYPAVKILHYDQPVFSFGHALNQAFKEAKGDILVALSAHAYPASEYWLKNLIEPFEDPQVAGVYGRQLPHKDAWPPVEREYCVGYGANPLKIISAEKVTFSNANSAIRKSCWQERFFAEHLMHTEDVEWAHAMVQSGYIIHYRPKAEVYHSHNESLKQVFDRCYKGMKGYRLIKGGNRQRELGVFWIFPKWYGETSRDIRWVLEKKTGYKWIFIAPVYRLFYVLGLISADMPGALWVPLEKVCNKISKKMIGKTESAPCNEAFPVFHFEANRESGLRLREIWRYRELLFFLMWRDIKVRYKQTALGAAWAIIQPFMTMVIFSIFFGHLGKIPSDGIPYPLFSFTALVPWTFFANGLTQSSNSLVGSSNLITKVYFPRLIIPIASVLTGVIDFLLAFLVLIGMMLCFGLHITSSVIWLPVFLFLALVTALGAGFWLSALNVEFRDVRHVMPFLIQFWMFATPIAYPSSLLPEPWRTFYGLNPMTGVIAGFRWVLLGNDPPGPIIFVSAFTAILILISGLRYFRRMEKHFADVV